jgi:SpoVK/Ycf46/Vps4 family AAA+-type ATPase
MLDHFEMLKNNNFSVIVTLMTDNGPVSLPGLRPGRIDQFFSFDTPTTEDRLNLLHYYAPNVNFAGSDQLTRKFTPAYLKELAKRAVASGETDKKAWESAARSLQIQLDIVNR